MHQPTAHESGTLIGPTWGSGQTGRRQTRWHAPGLDVLRFALFLCVWLLHSVGRLPAVESLGRAFVGASRFGGFGVVGFFTLSSYLITRLLLIERSTTGRIRQGAYWWRRILRIWPLYFVLLAIAWVGDAVGVRGALPTSAVPYYLTFTFNWAVPLLPGPVSFLSHTWSIGVEEQAYLLLPLLALLGATGRWRVLVTLAALGPIARLVTIEAGARYPMVWNATTSHLDAIVIGAVLATVHHRHGRAWRYLDRALGGRRGPVVLTLGLIALMTLAGLQYPAIYAGRLSVVSYSLVSLLAAAAIVVAQRARCANPPARVLGWLGRRTYGLYMYHWPVLLSLEALDASLGWRFGPAQLVCSLVLTVVLAVLSYQLFEKRFLSLRRRFQAVVTD
ncbi:acyltransferase [Planosporangium thailandense]|uniref:Acyltransferase n=1 Tax=Planosporangium thailandense TaxID=765197 RepID=A0ABX0Y7J5_9ACTN|nr:acyltransferase [Planosporangium thailandense]NJC73377.1 acyltransferase [Planosporangium thailandense]